MIVRRARRPVKAETDRKRLRSALFTNLADREKIRLWRKLCG